MQQIIPCRHEHRKAWPLCPPLKPVVGVGRPQLLKVLSARTKGPPLAGTPSQPCSPEGGAEEPPSRLERADATESSRAGRAGAPAPAMRAEKCCCDSRLPPPLRMPPDAPGSPEAAAAVLRAAPLGPVAVLPLSPLLLGSPGASPPPPTSVQATSDASDSFRPGLAEGGLPPGVCVLLPTLLPPLLPAPELLPNRPCCCSASCCCRYSEKRCSCCCRLGLPRRGEPAADGCAGVLASLPVMLGPGARGSRGSAPCTALPLGCCWARSPGRGAQAGPARAAGRCGQGAGQKLTDQLNLHHKHPGSCIQGLVLAKLPAMHPPLAHRLASV